MKLIIMENILMYLGFIYANLRPKERLFYFRQEVRARGRQFAGKHAECTFISAP